MHQTRITDTGYAALRSDAKIYIFYFVANLTLSHIITLNALLLKLVVYIHEYPRVTCI